MMGGVITSYPLTLTYRKQFDGADGKRVTEIYLPKEAYIQIFTYPTLPTTSQQDDWYGQGTANEWNDSLVEPKLKHVHMYRASQEGRKLVACGVRL